MRWLTEAKVPRRMVCLVMMPDRISIWFIQLNRGEVERDVGVGLPPCLRVGDVVSGQIVQHLSISLPRWGFTAFLYEGQEIAPADAGSSPPTPDRWRCSTR